MLLSHNLSDIGDIVTGGHEVGQVVDLQHIITSRDDGLVASFDGHDMIRRFRLTEILQRFVQDLTGLAQLDA